jgi:putative hemolysin
MGKTVWIVLTFLVVAAAATGAYMFIQQTVLDPQQNLPPLAEKALSPSAVFCGTLGGSIEKRGWFAGEASYCILPDGRECEETALHQRNECVAP